MLLYGAISVVISLLYFLIIKEPRQNGSAGAKPALPLRQALAKVLRIRGIWLLGLAILGYPACMQGISGYLPLYLRNKGWTPASADGTLSAFNGISMVCAIPITMLSDRIGLRKPILVLALIITIIGTGLLSVAEGTMVWALMIILGIFRDGSAGLVMAMTIETEGVGTAYAGTAVGLVQTIIMSGNALSPVIGNSFAGISPNLPFTFWAFLGVIGIIILTFVKETGWRVKGG